MEERNSKQDVITRLDEFRISSGMTLNAFSSCIGMEQSTLHYQFHGKRALSLDTVLNTLTAYGSLSAEWLLRGTGNMHITEQAQEPEEDLHTNADNRLEALIDTIALLQETIKNKNATIDALQAELSRYKQKSKNA